MSFKKIFPIAVIVSFVSALYILVAQYLNISAMWLPYIGWSAYCVLGLKPCYLPKMIIGLTGGMVIGCMTVLLVPIISTYVGGVFALPTIVFIMCMVILLTELIKHVDMIPAYFFGWSSFFAYYFGGFGGKTATPINIMPLFWVLLVFGLGLGWLTTEIRIIMLKYMDKKKKK